MHDPCSLCTRRHQSQISDGDVEGQTQRPLPPGVPRRGAGQETPVPSPSCSPASPGQHGGAQDAWPPGTCADGMGRFAALQTRLRVGSAPPRLRASVRARVKWGTPDLHGRGDQKWGAWEPARPTAAPREDWAGRRPPPPGPVARARAPRTCARVTSRRRGSEV